MFLPYWTGQFRAGYFLLLIVMLWLLSYHLDLKGTGFLFTIYLLILLGHVPSKWGIWGKMLLSGLIVAKCFEELFDPDWMPLDIITSWPLPYIGILLSLRFPHQYQRFKLWIWALAILFYSTFPIFEYRLDYIAALVAALVAAVYFNSKWPTKWPRAEHVLPILIVLFFALEALPLERINRPETLTESSADLKL